MRVLLLSKYGRRGASSRVRSYQYLPALSALDISVECCPLFADAYLEALYAGRSRVLPALAGYWKRVRRLLGKGDAELLWIEKEALPWLPHWIERALLGARLPYLVDYDDAVFHRYQAVPPLEQKIGRVMKAAAAVVAGSDYLEGYARAAGARSVVKIPSSVDTTRYSARSALVPGPLTIGWVGTPLTARSLLPVLGVLEDCRRRGCRIVALGAGDTLRGYPFVESLPWDEATEASAIAAFDIGIMPLADLPFERGKCGYKLIQYMACGKPVVASPVGENALIVREGVNGILARSADDWRAALESLLASAERRARMGEAGRRLVESDYSLGVNAPKLARVIRDCARP